MPYLDKNYPLNVKNSDKDRLVFSKKGFIIFYSNKSPNDTYMTWLKRKTNYLINSRVEILQGLVGVKPARVKIKELKSKWGSITADRNMIININIMKTPLEIIDYIIVHELCHLHIDNHSSSFWRLLSKYDPHYKKKIEWLEINSNNIL